MHSTNQNLIEIQKATKKKKTKQSKAKNSSKEATNKKKSRRNKAETTKNEMTNENRDANIESCLQTAFSCKRRRRKWPARARKRKLTLETKSRCKQENAKDKYECKYNINRRQECNNRKFSQDKSKPKTRRQQRVARNTKRSQETAEDFMQELTANNAARDAKMTQQQTMFEYKSHLKLNSCIAKCARLSDTCVCLRLSLLLCLLALTRFEAFDCLLSALGLLSTSVAVIAAVPTATPTTKATTTAMQSKLRQTNARHSRVKIGALLATSALLCVSSSLYRCSSDERPAFAASAAIVEQIRFTANASSLAGQSQATRTDYALSGESATLSCQVLLQDALEEVRQVVWTKDGQKVSTQSARVYLLWSTRRSACFRQLRNCGASRLPDIAKCVDLMPFYFGSNLVLAPKRAFLSLLALL